MLSSAQQKSKGTKPYTKPEHSGPLPEDLLKALFQFFDLNTLLKAASVSRLWQWFADTLNIAPLINTADIRAAEKYIYDNSRKPDLLGLPKILGFNVSIHPLAGSVSALVFKYTSKFVCDNGHGWEPDVPCFYEIIPIKKVLFFADKERFKKMNESDSITRILNVEFNSLDTRQARNTFICTYVQYPTGNKNPRWVRLINQSMESLIRLKESLSRYTDTVFQNCIAEVDLAITYKLENTLSGKYYYKSLKV